MWKLSFHSSFCEKMLLSSIYRPPHTATYYNYWRCFLMFCLWFSAVTCSSCLWAFNVMNGCTPLFSYSSSISFREIYCSDIAFFRMRVFLLVLLVGVTLAADWKVVNVERTIDLTSQVGASTASTALVFICYWCYLCNFFIWDCYWVFRMLLLLNFWVLKRFYNWWL